MVQTELSEFEKKIAKRKFDKIDKIKKGEIDFNQFQASEFCLQLSRHNLVLISIVHTYEFDLEMTR